MSFCKKKNTFIEHPASALESSAFLNMLLSKQLTRYYHAKFYSYYSELFAIWHNHKIAQNLCLYILVISKYNYTVLWCFGLDDVTWSKLLGYTPVFLQLFRDSTQYIILSSSIWSGNQASSAHLTCVHIALASFWFNACHKRCTRFVLAWK